MFIVSVAVPWPTTKVGLKVAVEFGGNPRAEKFTVPVKPVSAVTVTM